MFSLYESPSNKKEFIKLKEFSKTILKICNEQNITPILYGSLAVFFYTQNRKMKVNDIDFLVSEKDLKKIIKVLEKRKIKYNYDSKWHVLQIVKKSLKIEFDSMDFWQKNLPEKYHELDFYGIKIQILSLNSLKEVYKKASQVSKDNPEGNRKKYKLLNGISPTAR